MTKLLEDYLDFETLAAEAGTSVRTIRRWARASVPALPVTKLGRRPLVHRSDFRDWLQTQRTQKNVVHRKR